MGVGLRAAMAREMLAGSNDLMLIMFLHNNPGVLGYQLRISSIRPAIFCNHRVIGVGSKIKDRGKVDIKVKFI